MANEPDGARSHRDATSDPVEGLLGHVGVVVIGRNEGARVPLALASAAGCAGHVVYVDSASTDGSAERARRLGVYVCGLAATDGLTAARGRNAGFSMLMEVAPQTRFVQFLDGDSVLQPGWLALASDTLERDSSVAAVCGILREKDHEQSLVRRLLDMEWHRASGRIHSPGGIFMVRAAEFAAAGMFDPSVAQGEEAEFAIRLRARGGQIVRLPSPMAVHDSGMRGLGPWWRRCRRGGRGYAEGVERYGTGDGGANARRRASCLLWGALLPAGLVGSVVGALFVHPAFAIGGGVLVAAWMLQAVRTAWRRRGDFGWRHALLYGAFCMIAKFPEAVGVLTYRSPRMREVGPQA